MRRLLISLVVSCSALLLAACGKDSENKGTENRSEQASASSLPQETGPIDFDKLESLKGFIAGTGGSVMAQPNAYILFDPQCPHCGELWRNAKPLYQQVKLKWIPVGFLNEKSKTQSGVLLEAKDPVDLMTRYEAEMAAKGNSAILDGSPGKGTLDEVNRNTQVLQNSGAGSVPAIFYRDPKNLGGVAMITGSAPTESIAALLGVPYSPK